MASNIKDHLVQSIRKKAKNSHGFSYEQFDEIEEKIYLPVQKEQWKKVTQILNSIEEEHGFNLEKQKELVEEITSNEGFDDVSEEEIVKDADSETKLLLEHKIQKKDAEKAVIKTDKII